MATKKKKTIEMDTFPHIRGFTEINSLERERRDCNNGLTRNRRANVYQGKVISHWLECNEIGGKCYSRTPLGAWVWVM